MAVTTRQQQAACLQAMGIQVWVSREVADDAPGLEIPTETAQANVVESPVLPSTAPESESLPVANEARIENTEAGNAQVDTAWVDEEPPLPTDDFVPGLDISEMLSQPAPAIDISSLDWPELQVAVSSCTACELHKTRTQTVFGVGDHAAEWMIIGEAPEADEDQQGEPFVGRAGQLLNNMLTALGLRREQVFIANILKCCPPENRNPQPEEIVHCEAFLQRQVALVKPKVILAVGGVAAHNLLKVDTAVSKLRGQLHHYGETPLVVTYHPAYLLRKPSEKGKSWTDLKFAAAVVRGEQS